VPLKSIVKETLPFTAISIFVLFLVSFFPYIILFLPRLFNFV
jgi:TRAP-type C4-dicarboxylate transport system permease large subunit